MVLVFKSIYEEIMSTNGPKATSNISFNSLIDWYNF